MNIQSSAFYKHIHTKKVTISCSLSAAKNVATCAQAAHGLAVVKCLHCAYTTGVALLGFTRFQGLDKILLRELECLAKELSSAGSHWIPLSHILCLKWGLQSLLWCLIPIHLHAFFLQLQSSKKNNLINSTSVAKSTDAREKLLIKMLGTAQFCLCLLGLGRWTKHWHSRCKNLWLSAPKALVLFLQPNLCE